MKQLSFTISLIVWVQCHISWRGDLSECRGRSIATRHGADFFPFSENIGLVWIIRFRRKKRICRIMRSIRGNEDTHKLQVNVLILSQFSLVPAMKLISRKNY